MNFAKPELALLLLAIPLLIYYLRLIFKIVSARREKLFSSRNYSSLANFETNPYTAVRALLVLAGLTMAIIAAMRPQGIEKLDEYQARAMDICFAIDCSESMKALDLGRYSRLEITKAVVAQLIDSLRTDRIGIIGFAGDASCVCPLTMDHNAAKTLLQQIDFDTVEKGGTRLDYALETARARFTRDENVARAIIVFTDGEDQEGDPLAAAGRAYKDGIIIYTVGIGDPKGVPIPESRDVWGDVRYKRYKGREVITRLNEEILEKIASQAEGRYFHVGDQKSLDSMVASLKKMDRRAVRSASVSKREELFHYFAWIALAFLIAEYLIPPRVMKKSTLALFAAFLLLAAPAAASVPTRVSERPPVPPVPAPDDESNRKIKSHLETGAARYGARDFYGARSEYQGARMLDPRNFASNYNAGCAEYRNRDYASAVGSFEKAIASDASKSRYEPYYNMGNSYFRMDDFASAIKAYEDALKIKPDDEDTKFNLELARRKLAEQEEKKRREQEKKQQQDGQDKQDKKEGQQQQQQGRQEGDKKEGRQQQQQGQGGQEKKGDRQQNASGNDKKSGDDKKGGEGREQDPGREKKAGENSEGEAGKEGQPGSKDLVDRGNVEKYKNLKIDQNRAKLYLRDLEKMESEISGAYRENRKRMRRPLDEMDIFNMSPDQIDEYMQKRLEGREQDEGGKGDADRKDW